MTTVNDITTGVRALSLTETRVSEASTQAESQTSVQRPLADSAVSKGLAPYQRISSDIRGIIGAFACSTIEGYERFCLVCKDFKQVRAEVFKGNGKLVSEYFERWARGEKIPEAVLGFIDSARVSIRRLDYLSERLPIHVVQKIREFPNLEELAFSRFFDPLSLAITQSSDSKTAELETNIPLRSLRKLKILCVADLSLKQIATISTLQELCLLGCNLQSDAPTQLTQLQNLRFLDLDDSRLVGAPSLGDTFAPVLCKFPHLIGLSLQNTKLTDSGLAHIAKVTNLTSLNVNINKAITDAGVLCLQKLPLRKVDFSEAQITNSAISNCLGKMQLEKLNLEGCGKISAGALTGLQHIALLEELNLSCIDKADEMLVGIEKATNLKVLNVSHTLVTGEFLKNIAKAFALATTNIEKPKLQRLHLGGTKTCVSTLPSLATITTLTALELSRLPITDSEIQHITKLPNLHQLVLNNTLITDSGLLSLASLTKLSALYVFDCKELANNGLLEFAQRKKLFQFFFKKTEKISQDVVPLLQELMPQCILPSIVYFD